MCSMNSAREEMSQTGLVRKAARKGSSGQVSNVGSMLEARVLARALRDQRRRGTLDLRQALKEWREELRYRRALKAWSRG
jgi:hypothetical protein